MNHAGKRLERAVALGNRLQELQRQVKRLTAAAALVDEQIGGLEYELTRELTEAKDAVLDEQAHHMDHHPTELSVLRGGR